VIKYRKIFGPQLFTIYKAGDAYEYPVQYMQQYRLRGKFILATLPGARKTFPKTICSRISEKKGGEVVLCVVLL
jgi:hypothetical protein